MQRLPVDLFRQHLPEMVTLLRELVTIESPTTDQAAVDRLGQRVLQALSDLGGEVQVMPQSSAGDHILYRWGAGAGRLLVLCHLDTVFPLGTLVVQPVRESDGKLYGPGVSDMKVSIAMLLTILRLFRSLDLKPTRPITALFTSDEETGSQTSRPIIESEASQAGLAFCLEPALASGAIKTARKGTGDIEILVTGRAAHAGIDHEKGRNAIEELAYHILEAQRLTDYPRGTTVNVGVVSGGTRGNVVPDEAHALIDFRVTHMDEFHRLERWAKGLTPVIDGTHLSAVTTLNRPPMPRDENMARTFHKAQVIAAELGLALSEGSTGGGSDANFIAPLGIPVLDGLGAVGDGAHSAREFIWIESLAERSALLANLMLDGLMDHA